MQKITTSLEEAAEAGGHSGRTTPVWRTGAEQPWDPEDLAVAQGKYPTPENIARARAELERDGAAAIERTVP
ncbi:hypothetical protein [Actinoplanes aureus]|uniref:Uncharacterized protein n=1 Tax=Actinoplanes aureus TaxID=2792083 RepID=A0A931G0Z0_9ACTN|nr:hypothetical protein [Actinoplanes aureus]MBG0561854.1 hypothetical protein [Actinoplanes aureus]